MSEFLHSEKYRPTTVADTILPLELQKTFQGMVDEGFIPNMTLTGSFGIGKSTVIRAVLNEIGADFYKINGSSQGSIEILRTEITDFVSTVSFDGGRKYVLIEEADGMSAKMQDGLKDFIEEYSANAGFILTSNHYNKIIGALQSRCPPVEFVIPKAERPKLAAKFFARVEMILQAENIPYDRGVLAEVIQKFYPDFRKTLNVLQRYSKTGKIDVGILSRGISDEKITVLIGFLKARQFTEARKWVAEHSDVDSDALYTSLYDALPDYLNGSASLAAAIIVLAEYQFKEAFVANSEINRVAAIAQLMAECSWKE